MQSAPHPRPVPTARRPWLIAATCKLTYARELKGELRQSWDRARAVWSAHPGNQSRVKFVSITAFGRQVEGVRRSAF